MARIPDLWHDVRMIDTQERKALHQRLSLALLLSPRPVPVSQFGAWNLADMAETLRWLSEVVGEGVTRESVSEAGKFEWIGEPARVELLFEEVSDDDVASVVQAIEFPTWALQTARERAENNDFSKSEVLYRALIRWPEGRSKHQEWLLWVLEALSLFRREVNWLSPEIRDTALTIATQCGDSAAEAVLLATQAYEFLRSGRVGEAASWCERALALTAGRDDSTARQHVLLYVANCWILMGKLTDALSLLESFLGDIPAELVPNASLSGRTTVIEASIATLANAYAWTGRVERAISLLERMVSIGSDTRRHVLAKMGKVHLSCVYAELGDLDRAVHWGRLALEHLEGTRERSAYVWFACQAMAWVAMRQEDSEAAVAYLRKGNSSRLACGHTHFQNGFLLDVLAWLESRDFRLEELGLAREIERLLGSGDERMMGIARRFLAEQLIQSSDGAGERDVVARYLEESISLLTRSGAVPELIRVLRAAVDWATRCGEQQAAGEFSQKLRDVEQIGSTHAVSAVDGAARESHVARAIVDLGRLTLLAHRREGFFGEVVARICRELAVERCALFDTSQLPRVMAVRGGSTAWLAGIEEVLKTPRPYEVCFLSAVECPEGQLVLIPYRIDELGRKGWLCMENCRTTALIGPADSTLLGSLGVQISVLISNVELWEELVDVRQRLERENHYYREQKTAPASSSQMIGVSSAFRRLYDLIAKVGPTKSAALVLGETGVGKELVAREIHMLSSHRAGPFIAVHVASMPQGLVAAALFGHERGAFTGAIDKVRGRFELADGGTIFLDEIGELGLEDQVRLLRVLQEGTFERVGGTKTLQSNFRLVAATNRDLKALVREGRFREDLFYRLNVFPIEVPPLRERKDDIPLLALAFLEQFSRQTGRVFEGIGEADVERLMSYKWPGNIRELAHVVERAVVLSEPPMLKVPVLDADGSSSAGPVKPATWVTLEEWERHYVREVLLHTKGRITGKDGAASILGLKPSTLQWRIDKLGLRSVLGMARVRPS